MTSELWLFIDFPVICLLVIGIIFFDMVYSKDERAEIRALKLATVVAFFFILMDLFLDLCAEKFIPFNFTALYFVNILYNVIGFVLAFSWTHYINVVFGETKRTILYIFMGLFIVICILSVVLMNTDYFLFEVIEPDGSVTFNYGILDILWFIPEIPLIISSLLRGLIKMKKDGRLLQKEKIRSILLFSFMMLAVGLIQMLSYNAPLIGFAITIPLVFLYISTIRFDVSKDELTGLDNRRQLYRDVNNLLHDSVNVKSNCLIILDIDKFKSINDGFGHNEGDEALKILSSSLKKVCTENDCKAYRYGGDEFIVLKSDNPLEIDYSSDKICNDLKETLHEYNQTNQKIYKLEFTYGKTVFQANDGSGESLEEIIERADRALYEEKEKSHILQPL